MYARRPHHARAGSGHPVRSSRAAVGASPSVRGDAISRSHAADEILAHLGQHRRQLAGVSPEAFAKVYLGSYCTKPFSRMHRTVYATLLHITHERGARVALAAPRGHAKSTMATLTYVLWCLLYKKEELVMVISNTSDQAVKLLGHIKEQLETNALLAADFPEVASPTRRLAPWQKSQLKLGNGTMVIAYGSGQRLRGARAGRARPGLIVIDDLDDKNTVHEQDQRDKTWEWANSVVFKCGTRDTNIVVVGTVLHEDSFLARLLDPKQVVGWMRMRYQAVERFASRSDLWSEWEKILSNPAPTGSGDELSAARAFFEANQTEMLRDAVVLWPQYESYYDLMLMRIREGRATFASEKQNEPVPPGRCLFASAPIEFWDEQYPTVEKLCVATSPGHPGNYSMGVDPSLGKPGSDYAAIVLLYKPYRVEKLYVIECDIGRYGPHELVQRVLQMCSRQPSYISIGFETNGFQSVLIEAMERQARGQQLKIYVEKINNHGNKVVRINALEALIGAGRLVFCRRHTQLLEQLREFPTLKHDDGPDALEMAVRVSRLRGHGVAWITI